MTRPIEFRAWDGKQMLTTRDRCFVEFDGDIWQNKGGAYSHDDLSELDVQLMQFTGLTDKNGVKIFEGDLVRCDYEGLFEEITVTGVIEIRSFELWLDMPERGESVALSAFAEESFEVIGNIHEHSELLEAK